MVVKKSYTWLEISSEVAQHSRILQFERSYFVIGIVF